MKLKNPRLTPRAQKMRREMTREERHLWYDYLQRLPVSVHRQKVMGNYLADFYIATAKLIIEVDGGQHFTTDGKAYDAIRNAFFESCGYRVLRFSNSDVMQRFDAVCREIQRAL